MRVIQTMRKRRRTGRLRGRARSPRSSSIGSASTRQRRARPAPTSSWTSSSGAPCRVATRACASMRTRATRGHSGCTGGVGIGKRARCSSRGAPCRSAALSCSSGRSLPRQRPSTSQGSETLTEARHACQARVGRAGPDEALQVGVRRDDGVADGLFRRVGTPEDVTGQLALLQEREPALDAVYGSRLRAQLVMLRSQVSFGATDLG